MATADPSTTAAVAEIEPLPWDSAHFGFPVGRITGATDDALAEALDRARDQGFALVYVATDPDAPPPPGLLRRRAGLKVDDRLVFAADLDCAPSSVASESLTTVALPRATPSRRLVDLAIEAGGHSRFGVDPRIPAEAFRRMYEIWITRSCLGESADAVLTTARADAADQPLGLVTLSIRDESATIGLLAVHRDARRRGVGAHTVGRAHDWLRARGVRRATVATQLENTAARRLYQACGYHLFEHTAIYHFWPQAANGS